jgi:hypothetical protein
MAATEIAASCLRLVVVLVASSSCSGGSTEHAANNEARLETMAEADYEVIARAVASGKLGSQAEALDLMIKAAESSADGDNVGVEPFRSSPRWPVGSVP